MVADLLSDILSRYGRDLTALARAGQLKRAYGRDRAVRTLLRVLGRDVRHNPLVVGPARCGKTALVHEAACRLAAGEGPASLRGRRVVEVTPASLVAGLDWGPGWRINLDRLLVELERRDDVIIFLRDAHAAAQIGGGGEVSLAALLGPYLSRASQYWIAEGLDWRMRDLGHRYPAWNPAFVRLPLGEASPEETRRILDAVCEDVYLLHNIMVDEAAREAIVDTARRFVPAAALPGKAIDWLEEVLKATGPAPGERYIGPNDVYRCFSERTGLNRLFLDPAITFREAPVAQYLSEYVLGQGPAVDAVVRGLGALRAGMGQAPRPLAVWWFVGPPGVGKTELARTLAQFVFGRPDRFIRLDMAAVSEAQLWGVPAADAPEADRRGLFAIWLEQVAGHGVLLLEEFPRASPAIQARFQQLLDQGQFINGLGEPVSLRNAILVFTSTDVTSVPGDPLALLLSGETEATLIARALQEVTERVPPALLDHAAGVVVFKPLAWDDRRRIAFRLVREALARPGLEVEIEDEVIMLLLERGTTDREGLRPLRSHIAMILTTPVDQALTGQSGDLLRLYVRQGQVEAALTPPDEVVPPSEDEASQWTLKHVQEALPGLVARFAALEERDQIPTAQARVDDLLRIMGQPGFWDDEPKAHRLLTELESLSRRVERANALRRALAEAKHLATAAQDSRDSDLAWQALRAYAGLMHDLNAAELESCLTGPWDRRDALLFIHPGSDDHAWAVDVARMILAWARFHRLDGFEAEVWSETPGYDVPGVSGIIVHVRGEGAYGFLKGEAGTHRLTQGRQRGAERIRQVLQARVFVLPAWRDDELVALSPDDVLWRRWSVRASGELIHRRCNQVMAFHRPSRTRVACTSPLPPDQVEAQAIWLLRAWLTAQTAGLTTLAAQPLWGTVVRTYDQYHTNQVRDRRTGCVVSDVRHVLAGHIDAFLEAALRQAQ